MVHGIIILGHGQPWSMVLSYHGHGIIMDSHGQWYYHAHCNSTRWPFQPLPILPPSPAFPPPHGSSSIRTTHHQGFKSSRRSHNAILRLFHLRNTHLPRLTLDDSRVSRKSLFNDSFFCIIRTVTPLSHPRDQHTSTYPPRKSCVPALQRTFGGGVLLVVFLRSSYLGYV